MNPFGLTAGEMPDDVADRHYDAATVFKNFTGDTMARRAVRREGGSGRLREFVVEVRKPKRFLKDS